MKIRAMYLLIIMAIVILFAVGCETDNNNVNNNNDNNFENLEVADDFLFSTLHDVEIELAVNNGNDTGVSDIVFDIYDTDPNEGGTLLYSGATGDDGVFNAVISLPTALEDVFFVGYMTSMELPIVSGKASYTFGNSAARANRSKIAVTPPKSTLEYVLPFSSNGTPIGMEFDVLEAEFLAKVNATLPEGEQLQDSHPDYLAANVELNVVLINETADLWVTFVHEGAGHKNCLGYYTYQQGNEPTTPEDIETINMVFPNTSMVNSGGGLVPGDKVYLGQFEPGTVVGWVLMDNGWFNGTANIVTDTWYSNFDVSHHDTQQSILVYDNEFEKLLFAFEDIQFPNGDNDFNDAVFYCTASPVTSVDITDVPPIDEPGDTDGDGISDIFDDFPEDPERAFETNDHTYSTLAFEDMWPRMGDYDFNDMVIDYNFFYHTKADNVVAHIIAEFKLMAVGARFQNGFAVQFPFDSDMIESITIIDGSDALTYSTVISDASFNPVLENGSNATIVFIQNTNDMIPQSPGQFINTEFGATYVNPVEFAVDIKLVPAGDDPNGWQWQPPFNPFIYVDRARSHEVHLADMPPTSEMDFSLFGMDNDDTVVSGSRYYRTNTNLPWAINVAYSWDHPYERKQITEAYLKFKQWAESSGFLYPDWYLEAPGYRDDSNIYMIP